VGPGGDVGWDIRKKGAGVDKPEIVNGGEKTAQ